MDTGSINNWISYFVETNLKTFQISGIYINPDFRRKTQIPNLAIVKLAGDLTKNSVAWTFYFDHPVWSNPDEIFYPQDHLGENFCLRSYIL